MILVLSGTADGRRLAGELKSRGYQVMASTLTGYGKELLQQESDDLDVLDGGLDAQELEELITVKRIRQVIDATHPFAVRVSFMAMEVCNRLNTGYIRYERAETVLPEYKEGIITVSSFTEAAQKVQDYTGNVFLTIGSRHLETFCEVILSHRIIARVLPQSEVLKKCEEMGLLPRNIVAAQGPFSREMNRALFKQYEAGVVVTKDSGKTGGTEEKIEAALELGIPVIVVNRPTLEYPVVVRDIESLLSMLGDC